MGRRNSFDQDFADLHGVKVMRRAKARAVDFTPEARNPDETMIRLAVGALGLFWSIILIAVLFAMGAVAWAVISSVGAPPIQ